MSGPQLLVFSDLDGTLLDHDTYDHSPALPALAQLRAVDAQLILVTSKTFPEVMALRQSMGLQGPFAVENGGALYLPPGLFKGPLDGGPGPLREGMHEIMLGVDYARIRQALSELRQADSLDFEGFGDVSDQQVAQWTGLTVQAASKARDRASSEPLLFRDAQGAGPALLASGLEERGLKLVRGGRFFSAQGPANKGSALRHLVSLFAEQAQQGQAPCPFSIALGDSDNDLPMLAAADLAIPIRPKHGRPHLRLDHPRIFLPPSPGPRGFREGIEHALQHIPPGRLNP